MGLIAFLAVRLCLLFFFFSSVQCVVNLSLDQAMMTQMHAAMLLQSVMQNEEEGSKTGRQDEYVVNALFFVMY